MRYLPWLLFGVTALALVGWVSFTIGSKQLQPAVTTNPTPTLTSNLEPTSTSIDSLKTYSHSSPKYIFKYPSDLNLQTQTDGSVILTKWGPTQQEGTEFYDGISLNFKTGSLEGMTVNKFADKMAAELGGVFETGPIAPASAGSLMGHKFHVKGYVEADYYYLDLGANSYLEVIDASKDPTNAGFTATISQVLGSLTQ